MHYLFLISGENAELAKAEMELFADAKIKEHAGSSVIAEASPFETNRLAYTKVLCKYLFSCKRDELTEQVKKYAWNKCTGRVFMCTCITRSRIMQESWRILSGTH